MVMRVSRAFFVTFQGTCVWLGSHVAAPLPLPPLVPRCLSPSPPALALSPSPPFFRSLCVVAAAGRGAQWTAETTVRRTPFPRAASASASLTCSPLPPARLVQENSGGLREGTRRFRECRRPCWFSVRGRGRRRRERAPAHRTRFSARISDEDGPGGGARRIQS